MTASHFSVLISVYHAEIPSNLDLALRSIMVDQSLLPGQVVLVIDGPIGTGLEAVVNRYLLHYPELLCLLRLEKNMGLGNALRKGLELCRYELVARMDSDDISHYSRFEKQFQFLNSQANVAVVGANIEEFILRPGDLKQFKVLPEDSKAIHKYSKKRSPVNHPSIMFRKSAVIAAGGYNDDFRLFEDYGLFVRMLNQGFQFYNIQEVLLYFRIGDRLAMIKRRSGWKYMKNEVRFLNFAYKTGHFNAIEFVRALSIRVPVRLLPPYIILKIYTSFLRK